MTASEAGERHGRVPSKTGATENACNSRPAEDVAVRNEAGDSRSDQRHEKGAMGLRIETPQRAAIAVDRLLTPPWWPRWHATGYGLDTDRSLSPVIRSSWAETLDLACAARPDQVGHVALGATRRRRGPRRSEPITSARPPRLRRRNQPRAATTCKCPARQIPGSRVIFVKPAREVQTMRELQALTLIA